MRYLATIKNDFLGQDVLAILKTHVCRLIGKGHQLMRTIIGFPSKVMNHFGSFQHSSKIFLDIQSVFRNISTNSCHWVRRRFSHPVAISKNRLSPSSVIPSSELLAVLRTFPQRFQLLASSPTPGWITPDFFEGSAQAFHRFMMAPYVLHRATMANFDTWLVPSTKIRLPDFLSNLASVVRSFGWHKGYYALFGCRKQA